MPRASYVDPRNGTMYPLDVPRWCSDDRTPLLVTPSAGISRDEIDARTRSLWRYQAALPVRVDRPITLGEGCTPLVEQAWGDLRPHFKLEWFNPTGSFKDRGSAVARQGLFAEPTSASGAAALDKLAASRAIKPNENTVVILTGTGLKASSIVADLVGQETRAIKDYVFCLPILLKKSSRRCPGWP
jgi:threonine synthase